MIKEKENREGKNREETKEVHKSREDMSNVVSTGPSSSEEDTAMAEITKGMGRAAIIDRIRSKEAKKPNLFVLLL